ncbi:hypothetical protein QFZ70_001491 [Arthrobacter sp. V1I9]|uniref:hypothetical protein n=1 Tax=Arthrobacter sp. V1I9 TaxID=3042275 RepID=UPI00278E05CC|nr:hypothetical protein [Arthrobacter sp. V1I9]MDQ0869018.1 hypothetical protein [Arthrobacter sp. V1I9]
MSRSVLACWLLVFSLLSYAAYLAIAGKVVDAIFIGLFAVVALLLASDKDAPA